MDFLSDTFQNFRKEIDELKKEVFDLNFKLRETQEEMIKICESLKRDSKEKDKLSQTDNSFSQTNLLKIPAKNIVLKPLKPEILSISIGNKGVPADRQTIRQTDRQAFFNKKDEENPLNNATELLESLNSIKKELRLKFKKLTDQEILVFSKIYQLDEEKGYSDYKMLSEQLNLTQSSIRDYVCRLISKGIPIDKNKVKNKNIRLNISENLKKIATLSTVLQLREL